MTQPVVKTEYISFYTATKDGDIFPDMGREVVFPGFEEFCFILHSWEEDIYDPDDAFDIIDSYTWWYVTELTTGYRITDRSDSEEQAVYNAFQKLTEVGLEKLKSAIDKKPKVPKYIQS